MNFGLECQPMSLDSDQSAMAFVSTPYFDHNVLKFRQQHPFLYISKHSTMSSDLIADFPAQARRKVVRSKPKKKMVRFSAISHIQFYERPDKVHASELRYSREDIREFKIATRRAVRDIHMKRLSLAKTTTEDANEILQGCELTGIERMLTPGVVALKKGYKNAVLYEQERQDASGYHDPDRLARAAEDYSRWATQRALKIGIMNHMSVTMSSR